jgi:hypothetical protein
MSVVTVLFFNFSTVLLIRVSCRSNTYHLTEILDSKLNDVNTQERCVAAR